MGCIVPSSTKGKDGDVAVGTELMLGDCLDLMEKIPDGSIDMVLCDLPYGVLNKGNKSAEWDRPIPLDVLWERYERIVKPNGAIVLFGSGMFTAQLMQSNEKLWRYNLIWEKDRPTGFLNSKKMPLRSHEDIVVFYKKAPVYHAQMVYAPDRRNHSVGDGEHTMKNGCYGKFDRAVNPVISDWKYPRSVIKVQREHDFGGSDDKHTTQKPVELCEWLIRTYTDDGDTVLDNCMGSGSTGVACVKTGRNFIGMEISRDFYEMAQKRISTADTKTAVAKKKRSEPEQQVRWF